MDSDVESGHMTDFHINRIFRRKNMVKNTPGINPKSLEYII